MVAPLAVFALVVDHAVLDLDLANAEIALEVGCVVVRVPQAELDRGEERQIGWLGAAVGERHLPDLERVVQRHKIAQPRLDPLAG